MREFTHLIEQKQYHHLLRLVIPIPEKKDIFEKKICDCWGKATPHTVIFGYMYGIYIHNFHSTGLQVVYRLQVSFMPTANFLEIKCYPR